MRRPSGLIATEFTMSLCPSKERSLAPVATSQRIAVWSPEPETTLVPSGLNATECTKRECPVWVIRSGLTLQPAKEACGTHASPL